MGLWPYHWYWLDRRDKTSPLQVLTTLTAFMTGKFTIRQPKGRRQWRFQRGVWWGVEVALISVTFNEVHVRTKNFYFTWNYNETISFCICCLFYFATCIKWKYSVIKASVEMCSLKNIWTRSHFIKKKINKMWYLKSVFIRFPAVQGPSTKMQLCSPAKWSTNMWGSNTLALLYSILTIPRLRSIINNAGQLICFYQFHSGKTTAGRAYWKSDKSLAQLNEFKK